MDEARQFLNPITGWWQNQVEPRVVVPLIAAFYVLMIAAGGSALGYGPVFLEVGLGDFLLAYWSGLLIGGGAVGVFVVLRGWHVLERLALLAIGTAVLLYIGTLFSLEAATAQDLDWRMYLDCGLLIMLAIRYVRVRRGLRDPERYSTYRPPAD